MFYVIDVSFMMQFYECIYFFSSSYQRKNLSLVFPLIFNNKSLSGNKIKIGDLTITDGDLVSAMSINYALKYDFEVDVNSYFNANANASKDDLSILIGGTVSIKAGKTSVDFIIGTVDNHDEEPTEKFLFSATGYKYLGKNKPDNDLGSLLIMNGTIIDDFFNHEVINNFGFICKEVA